MALIVLLLMSTSVLSQSTQLCRDRLIVLEYLLQKYSEKPLAVMIDSYGQLVELLVNIETGTWSWSIVVTTPRNNIGCVVAFGHGVQFIQYEEPGSDIQQEEPELNQQEFPPYRSER